MAINVACDCGKTFKVKDELAGKKVKCPACQSVLTIPEGSEEDEAPASSVGRGSARNDNGGPKAGKKNSKVLLFVGLGVGVVMLGFCCIGVGVAGWLIFGRSSPEKQIVGKWTVDIDALKKNMPKEMKGANDEMLKSVFGDMSFEFKADNTMNIKAPGFESGGKWKYLSSKDDVVTIELTYDKTPPDGKKTDTGKIKIIDKDHIQLISDKMGQPDLVLKRV